MMALEQMVSIIKREIKSLKYSSEYVDYCESDSLAERVNDLRLEIVNDLNAKSPKVAFEMMLKLLDTHENTIDRCDDSNGTVGDAFKTACEDLGSLAQKTNHLNCQEIIELVFSLFMNNEYGVYDDIIHHFKDILKDEGLNSLQEYFERAANDKISITHALESIADCKNDVDLYIRACSFKDGKFRDFDHVEIAKRFIKHRRAPEALKWLETMKMDNSGWRQARHELKIEALELDGKQEQAQKERLLWFDETLNPKLYGDILKASEQDVKDAFQSDAIKKAFQFPEPDAALKLLVQIQEAEAVAKFVRNRVKELNGSSYFILRTAADVVKNTDPIATTLLYRKVIEEILETKSSSFYDHAAQNLVACGVLNAKIKNWEEFQRHGDYFKDIEMKHKSLRGFWAIYKSALQNQAAKEAERVKNG